MCHPSFEVLSGCASCSSKIYSWVGSDCRGGFLSPMDSSTNLSCSSSFARLHWLQRPALVCQFVTCAFVFCSSSKTHQPGPVFNPPRSSHATPLLRTPPPHPAPDTGGCSEPVSVTGIKPYRPACTLRSMTAWRLAAPSLHGVWRPQLQLNSIGTVLAPHWWNERTADSRTAERLNVFCF